MDKVREQTARKAHFFKQGFASTDGEKVLNILLEEFGGVATTFDPTNSHKTSFNEGQRSVVLYIQQMINFEEKTNG